MSAANASPTGRSNQFMSAANASPTGRSNQFMSAANASPTGRSNQLMAGTVRTVVCVLLLAGLAYGHHSFTAEYDQKKPVKLTGKVTEMKWSNPHGWIYIDVTGPDGKVVNWGLETGAANALYRRGWRKEDLPVGTVLVVEGWQARNGTPTANVSSITFTNGKRLFAGSSNQEAPQQ